MNQKMDERLFALCVGSFKRKKVESRESQRERESAQEESPWEKNEIHRCLLKLRRWCLCLKLSDFTIFFSFGDHE